MTKCIKSNNNYLIDFSGTHNIQSDRNHVAFRTSNLGIYVTINSINYNFWPFENQTTIFPPKPYRSLQIDPTLMV